MKVLSIALVLGAATLAAPAMADEAPLSVKYDDLDLATAQGQAALDRRINQAALQKCGRGISTGPVLRSGRARECYERARQSTRQSIAEATAESTSSPAQVVAGERLSAGH